MFLDLKKDFSKRKPNLNLVYAAAYLSMFAKLSDEETKVLSFWIIEAENLQRYFIESQLAELSQI